MEIEVEVIYMMGRKSINLKDETLVAKILANRKVSPDNFN